MSLQHIKVTWQIAYFRRRKIVQFVVHLLRELLKIVHPFHWRNRAMKLQWSWIVAVDVILTASKISILRLSCANEKLLLEWQKTFVNLTCWMRQRRCWTMQITRNTSFTSQKGKEFVSSHSSISRIFQSQSWRRWSTAFQKSNKRTAPKNHQWRLSLWNLKSTRQLLRQ